MGESARKTMSNASRKISRAGRPDRIKRAMPDLRFNPQSTIRDIQADQTIIDDPPYYGIDRSVCIDWNDCPQCLDYIDSGDAYQPEIELLHAYHSRPVYWSEEDVRMVRSFDPLSTARTVRTMRWLCDIGHSRQSLFMDEYGVQLALRLPTDKPDRHHYEVEVVRKDGTTRVKQQRDFSHFHPWLAERASPVYSEDDGKWHHRDNMFRFLETKRSVKERGNDIFWIGPTRRDLLRQTSRDKLLDGSRRLLQEVYWFVTRVAFEPPPADSPEPTYRAEKDYSWRKSSLMNRMEWHNARNQILHAFYTEKMRGDIGVDRERIRQILIQSEPADILTDYLLESLGLETPERLRHAIDSARWCAAALEALR